MAARGKYLRDSAQESTLLRTRFHTDEFVPVIFSLREWRQLVHRHEDPATHQGPGGGKGVHARQLQKQARLPPAVAAHGEALLFPPRPIQIDRLQTGQQAFRVRQIGADLDAAPASVDLDDFADFKELRHPIR